MIPGRLSDNGFVARSSESFEGKAAKSKTAAGIAVDYAEVVLDLTTEPAELAADRMRSLLSDSLIEIGTLINRD